LVANFDVADAADSADTWTASTTGETWTINRSTSGLPISLVGDYGKILFGGSHYLIIPRHPDMDYDASEGITCAVQGAMNNHTTGGGRMLAKTDGNSDGWDLVRYGTSQILNSRLDVGASATDTGDATNPNFTYGVPFVFTGVVADGDQEAFVDVTSVETNSTALTTDLDIDIDGSIGSGANLLKFINQFEILKASITTRRLTSAEVKNAANQWSTKGTI